jgi:outer membrane protein TolC
MHRLMRAQRAALVTLAGSLAACAAPSPFADLESRPAPAPSSGSGAPVSFATLSPDDAADPAAIGPDASLDDCLAYALAHSPAIEAALREHEAALARPAQAGALPDPRVTYGYYFNEVETRVGPMQHMIGLAQALPPAGTLDLRRRQAARMAEASRERMEATRLEVARRVTEAYVELAHLRRAIALTEENIALLGQFERVARARYRVSTASHPDVIRAQLELGRLEDRLRQLNDLRDPLAASLNAALGRDSGAPTPWPDAIPARILDEGDALAGLNSDNPRLRAMLEEIEAQRIGSDLARKQSVPEVTVGVTYTVVGQAVNPATPESGDDPLLASVSLNLPLWREKYDALVRESVARRLATAGARADMLAQLEADAQRALYDHRDAHRRVSLYRDTLIPKATESLRASLTGFEAGTIGFLDLLDTERTLLEFQLSLARARADRAQALARLEALVGGALPTRDAEVTP